MHPVLRRLVCGLIFNFARFTKKAPEILAQLQQAAGNDTVDAGPRIRAVVVSDGDLPEIQREDDNVQRNDIKEEEEMDFNQVFEEMEVEEMVEVPARRSERLMLKKESNNESHLIQLSSDDDDEEEDEWKQPPVVTKKATNVRRRKKN